ncbi:phosphodiester glycosidase family protein [Prauserella alba]|uniref:phosphodiester glycosidase family protein n=1 Tax=Prauserella alba TaxID=176898 RepID=UPI0020A39B0B|nr:phosphodiester glycosidase family protein [Prauserella alba]
MTRSRQVPRSLVSVSAACAVLFGGVAAPPAATASGVATPFGSTAFDRPANTAQSGTVLAPGVTHRPFTMDTDAGAVRGHVLTVDLREARIGLLHPGVVAERDEIPDMANAQGAIAGVNGDFFNISDSHEGIEPTGSSVGPAIAAGDALKGAVPDGQRFGPALPHGTSTRDVFGMGADRKARVSTLDVTGTVRTSDGAFGVDGMNQYALPENGIGVYTADWGPMSRVRPTCGTDTNRQAPCSDETEEVVVQGGVVVAERDEPGEGPIPAGATVLVGREDGADRLEALDEGDRVRVRSGLDGDEPVPPFAFAVGGYPILRDGAPLPGLDTGVLAPRTAAGVSSDGRTVYLTVVDGRSAESAGTTVAELADLLRSFGAVDGVNLDGGGSSTFVTREPGDERALVRNMPSDGKPRAVANGVGVFTR